MASFSVVVDTRNGERRLTKIEREQLPFANMLASNTAAYETMQTMRKSLDLFFDAPTPWLRRRAILYKKGTKDRPAAELYIPAERGKGGSSPVDVLSHHIFSGARVAKRSEMRLMRAGLIGPNERLVPADGMDLDQYGNVPPRKMVQILSALRTFNEAGYNANITKRSKARNPRRAQYFWSRGDVLPRGVYERVGRTKVAKRKYGNLPAGRRTAARDVLPVLLVVPSPNYRKRFDFLGLAAKEARRRFVLAFPAAMRRAVATARR